MRWLFARSRAFYSVCRLTRAGSEAWNTIAKGFDILKVPICQDFNIRDPYRGQLQLRRRHYAFLLTRSQH